tara:strand:+ start:3923 stop:6421 length:2499 start_codon:yes stop_codon:yes gene_type:complete
MAIESVIEAGVSAGMNGISPEDILFEEISVDMMSPEMVISETDDGGIVIDIDPSEMEEEDVEFDSNLADYCEEKVLKEVSSELLSMCGSDKQSRKDWEETYIKGLDQLGMKIQDRSTPWPGACGVQHPVLAEAVVRFQAQTITEIFPNAGPVKIKMIGRMTEEKEKQSLRVKEYMNYLITEDMPEYRSETEKMLFNLALAGSAFRKVYWDPNMGRPCSMFIPAEDLLVSYGAPSLEMAERITHVMKKTPNEMRKLQVSGFYRDFELSEAGSDLSDIQEKYDDLTGDSPGFTSDNRHTVLEVHVDLDLEGFEDMKDGDPTGIALPYVVSIDKGSGEVMAIRRNWIEDDSFKQRRDHFVHYEYLPGMGFYGFGLIHLIGGITKSATSLLRQLVDAGTLANLPGGLKARGLRIKGDDSPIMPGEFRDVDVPGGAIRDNITFLPYKEPSNVLFQLLNNIVEEGRRFASITDMKVSDMNQQAPVGTTLAIIERSMKVMNAIQARIHYAMKKEFKILSNIVRDYLPEDYEWEAEGDEVFKAQDFDDRIDVIPVSDPNSSTMAQRIMQYQAALQLASTAPQLYNLSELHRQMLDVLGIEDADKIVPTEDDVKALDPVSENMNLLKTDPVRAYMFQDHLSHIQVHMDAAKDPKMMQIIQSSPKAKQIEAAVAAHVLEHLGFQYRQEIEKELGVPLPPPDEPLPKDIEVRISALVAEAGSRLLGRDIAEQQLKEQMAKMKDPVIQQQNRELDIREAQVESKVKTDAAKIAADLKKAEDRNEIEKEKISSQEFLTGLKVGSDVGLAHAEMSDKNDERTAKELLEGVNTGLKMAEKIKEMREE